MLDLVSRLSATPTADHSPRAQVHVLFHLMHKHLYNVYHHSSHGSHAQQRAKVFAYSSRVTLSTMHTHAGCVL
jgi:hypothetical protein